MPGKLPQWFKADEVYAYNGQWFFGSREGLHIGPYSDRDVAKAKGTQVAKRLRTMNGAQQLKFVRKVLDAEWGNISQFILATGVGDASAGSSPRPRKPCAGARVTGTGTVPDGISRPTERGSSPPARESMSARSKPRPRRRSTNVGWLRCWKGRTPRKRRFTSSTSTNIARQLGRSARSGRTCSHRGEPSRQNLAGHRFRPDAGYLQAKFPRPFALHRRHRDFYFTEVSVNKPLDGVLR